MPSVALRTLLLAELRTLLLADNSPVSTQQPLRRAPKAAANAAGLALAFLSWIIAVVLVGVLAWLGGAEPRALAEATALALAPGVAGLALLPRREEPVALVEADRARRDVEFARQLADGKLGAFLFAGLHGRVQRF